VITGSARGAKLQTLAGGDVIRPTSQRVKEAMFSSVQFEIAGREVLDAFAGTGQLGIEALSRGAVICHFLEQNAQAQAVLRQNLEHTQLSAQSKVLQADALLFLRNTVLLFDVIFLDPPYGKQILQAALPFAAARLRPNGVILCEAPKGESLQDQIGTVVLERSYHHGKTSVHRYRNTAKG
jgi:16S rRNA (guanine(966)-N(2))-methyltransferase RsmD